MKYIIEEFPDYNHYPPVKKPQRINLTLVRDVYYVGTLEDPIYNPFVSKNMYTPSIIIDKRTNLVIGICKNPTRFIAQWEEFSWTLRDKIYHGVSGNVHVTAKPVKKVKIEEYDE